MLPVKAKLLDSATSSELDLPILKNHIDMNML